jgi:hypothetical protein
MIRNVSMIVIGFALLAGVMGCEEERPLPDVKIPETDGGMSGGHAHAAPHGGSLIDVGNHAAQLELVLNPETGRLTAYMLDAHAEGPIRLAQPSIEVTVAPAGGALPVIVDLKPVASELTGETAGDSSQFTAEHAELKGVKQAGVLIKKLEIRGREFTEISGKLRIGD